MKYIWQKEGELWITMNLLKQIVSLLEVQTQRLNERFDEFAQQVDEKTDKRFGEQSRQIEEKLGG